MLNQIDDKLNHIIDTLNEEQDEEPNPPIDAPRQRTRIKETE